MSIQSRLNEKIKKKEQEIQEYETKIREAKSYLQALQDAMKLLPREDIGSFEKSILRPNSNIGKTYALLNKIKKPMHVNDILKSIGKGTTKKERVSLSGSLGWYVRKKEIFTRPAPNTFGLMNMEEAEEPPDQFGLDYIDKEDTESKY